MQRVPSIDRRGSWFAALVISLTLLLAACGGSASPTVAPTATGLPATPTTVAAAPTATDPPTTVAPSPSAPPAALAPSAAPATSTAPALVPTAPTPVPTATVPPPTAAPAQPTAVPVPRAGQPTRVKIPVIRVDAAVEYVGLTPEGAMDVPKNYNNTAWYEPGPRPGDQGNAAIAGHVDSKTGKAVFWDLAKLKPGDEIFIVGDDGNERRFVVTGVQSYARADAPLQQIFGPTTSRNLNLITCDPTSNFNRTTGEYAANVVVYTEYKP